MPDDPVHRLSAALEGRYRVERELGEGGMATVYLADDLKHERKVALKVLKPHLAAVVGADRFLAEIKTTANLQHPHILPLHDSGETDGFLYYVMPYVDGESLRERLDREKQLPIDQALKIAVSVAQALQHAHARGVIHRDIKPANILLQDGQPLVSDFGIALAVGAAGGARLTETGLSIGTPYYMSPEQATGDHVIQPASDLFSLGCVLYEMLVGEPPYPGTTAQAVLGKVIRGDVVSATSVRPSVPQSVDGVIRKALERLPADRFASANELVSALRDPTFRYGESESGPAPVSRRWDGVTVGTMAIVALVVGTVVWAMARPTPAPVAKFTLSLPAGLAETTDGSNVALSPDGQRMVYRARQGDGSQLWLRRRDALEATPIAGTERGLNPVFSPDGERLAFGTVGGGIRTVSLVGGPPVTVASPPFQLHGLAWGADGHLYVDLTQGLGRVPETGGDIELFTQIDVAGNEVNHQWPDVLPNGRGVLFTVVYQPPGDFSLHEIAIADTETGSYRGLFPGSFARYLHPGYILYVSGDGSLQAVPFDQDRMEVTGSPVALDEKVAMWPTISVDLAVSREGSLAYLKGPNRSRSGREIELVWVTRSGEVSTIDADWRIHLGASTNDVGWSLSPDGTRVAYTEVTEQGRDVWVKRLPDGATSRLTYHEGDDRAPRWSPDGSRVTFVSDRDTDLEVWSKRWDGTGDAELVFDYAGRVPEGFWDGRGDWFVFRTAGLDTQGAEGSRDIAAIRPHTDSVPRPLVATGFVEQGAALSPDGRWLAYSSNETGRNEVFVRPFPDADSAKFPVSQSGGHRPRWSQDGRELFFVGDGPEGSRLVAARVEASTEFRVLGLEPLFDIGPEFEVVEVGDFYDVAPDGERFLFGRVAEGTTLARESSLILVLHIDEELSRLTGR